MGETSLDGLVVPSHEGNLECTEVLLTLEVILQVLHVSPYPIHQTYPYRVQLQPLYQLRLQLSLLDSLIQKQILLGLGVGGEVDALAADGADFRVFGRDDDGEDDLSFGEFDLVIVGADGFGQVLAVMEELEGGIGEGDLCQYLPQSLLFI